MILCRTLLFVYAVYSSTIGFGFIIWIVVAIFVLFIDILVYSHRALDVLPLQAQRTHISRTHILYTFLYTFLKNILDEDQASTRSERNSLEHICRAPCAAHAVVAEVVQIPLIGWLLPRSARSTGREGKK